MRSGSPFTASGGTLVPQRSLNGVCRGKNGLSPPAMLAGRPAASGHRRPYRVTEVSAGGEKNAFHNGSGTESDAAPIWPTEDDSPGLRRQRVEAVLLLSKSPLSPRKLSQLAHLADATEARTLVRELNQVYDEHHRAVRVEQVAGGYRLLTRPSLAPWLTRLGHLPPAMRLSSPMMETLAVVAYRQPVSRVNVEAVRGVACGELLRQLMERDLIRIAGRAEELGRPYLYGTTKRFLQLFGLSNTNSLPPIRWQVLSEPLGESLNEQSQPEDPPQEESSTSKKESVVSTVVAAESEMMEEEKLVVENPQAVIEDEEDDRYEGTGDFADDDDEDDWGDEDDDWADDDDEEDDDDDFDDDLEDDEWEEVDDSDSDDDDDELDELDDEWEEGDGDDDDEEVDDIDVEEWDDDDEEEDDDDVEDDDVEDGDEEDEDDDEEDWE